MALKQQPSKTSSPAPVSDPATSVGDVTVTAVPEEPGFDLNSFRQSDDGKALIAWAKNEFSRCKSAKTRKQRQWYLNMAFMFGHQWLSMIGVPGGSDSMAQAFKPRATPPYIQKRTVNRIRSFVRTEQSKFLSTLPVINAVPSTAEEEDIRAAYAAEQVWESVAAKRNIRREYSKAVWWMIVTGNGFVKCWWDPTTIDKTSGQPGDIMYRSVTPFHIFVPDLRAQEVDDQPYIIQAQVKTLSWVQQFWGEELKGYDLAPSQISANTLLDDAFFNLSNTPKSELDSVTVLEVWVKPGTHKLLPNGGLLVLVEDCLVGAFVSGMPYKHGEYPYTKLEHLSNDTFFADSPLVDLIELQKEFNDIRTQIGVAARRMGNPQLVAQQGSIVPGRMTNEPGAVIQYRPGSPPPQPIPLSPLPQYVTDQLQVVLTDFEDLSGQHQASKATAPSGVTAGTALSFLKEIDDSYLTPQYQNVEDGFERIATQTLTLFQQYVDTPRKIKVIGTDGTYDTALYQGADIDGATDVRVEPGSSVGQSQAAKRATVMDMFSVGIIQDPNQALRLLEVGGAQKILDTISTAEKKAQRENMKMKALATPQGQAQLVTSQQQMGQQAIQGLLQDPQSPFFGQDPQAVLSDPQIQQAIQQQIPPFIPADDFDIHAIHIDVHNRYRMGQEYETLPDPVKEQFDKHVQMHQMLMQQQLFQGGQLMDPNALPTENPVGDPTAGPPQGGPPQPQDPNAPQPTGPAGPPMGQ